MRTYSVAITIAMSLLAAALPGRVAKACTCSPEAIYKAQPKDGAAGVPRDIAPLLAGQFDETSITFEDEHGAKPKFTLNLSPRPKFGCVGVWAELVPDQPLAANTRYTIRVVALYDQRAAAVSFTTGSDELYDQPLAPPQLTTASVLRGAPDCGGVPVVTTCIGGLERQSPKDLELIARRGDKIIFRVTSYIEDDGAFWLEEQPDCVELRRRAPDGRRSEPTKICGAALLARDFQARDKAKSGWVECHDGILGDLDAWDDGADAGTVTPPAQDAAVAAEPEPDAGSPDTGAPRTAATPDRAAASGCSVHSSRSSNLQGLMLACAVLLGASRRYRRSA